MSESLYFYEQPLNERMRAFLRLEHLFNNIRSQISLDAEWASRGALSGIIDLTSLLTRAEIKGELIKELERNLHTFEALARDPRVDAQALTDATGGIQAILSGLKSQDGAFGYELKSNELINSVKQRSAIPAGTCDFDVPALHYWLHLDGTQRCADLTRWFSGFELVHDAVELCLSLVRRSATATQEVANKGLFQKTLDPNQPCQLVRVGIDANAPCFTEISAGKHRFTIRFNSHARPDDRPSQVDEDVPFELQCCTL